MVRILTRWTLLLLLFASHSQAMAQRTLQECMAIALDNNSMLRQHEISLKRQAIDHAQSRLNLLPTISANLSHSYSQGRSVDPTTNQFVENTFGSGSQGLSAGMTLFDGFHALHDIRMKGEARQAGLLEYEGVINEFKLDLIEAYIQVLTAEDMLIQARNQLEVTQEQVRRAEVMYQEGAFPPGDYFDLRGQIKSEQNQIQSTEQHRYNARLRLAKLMQIDERELGKLAALEFRAGSQTLQPDELFSQAQQGMARYRSLDYRIREARQQIGIARSGFYPSLSVHAGLNSRYSDQYATGYFDQFNQNLGRYVSVSLQIPLFNRLQTINQVRHARLHFEHVQLEQELQKHRLQEETAKAVFDLQSALAAVQNLEEQVDHYTESFRIAQVQFEAGASNSVNFLMAKNKADAARQQLLIKQYEYLLQQYINDYYRGTWGF